MPSKLIKVCTAQMCMRDVDVMVDPSSPGGSVASNYTPTGVSQIIIGLQRNQWFHILDLLLHESQEAFLMWNGLRFEQTGKWNDDLNHYTFILNHTQFQEMCIDVAYFISTVEPHVKKAWKNHHKKLKKSS